MTTSCILLSGAARAQPVGDELSQLAATLDGCIAAEASECLVRTIPAYMAAAKAAQVADGAAAAVRLQEATYYFDAARLALNDPQVTAQILAGPGWSSEIAYARGLYLRRRMLEARVQLALGREPEAVAAADKLLSLAAALQNPEVDRVTVARAVAAGIDVLAEAGQGQRAYGLFRATHESLAKLLPPHSLDLARLHMTEARLLGARGDFKGSARAAEAAIVLVRDLDLERATRAGVLSEAIILKAAACTADGDATCAKAALADQAPATILDARSRTADRAVRQAVAVLLGQTEPGLAVTALEMDRSDRWGALDLLVASVLLGGGDATIRDPAAAFALFQQASRNGSAFDAEAVARLSGARTEADRRAIHQALRLRARRDRIEREQVQAVLARAVSHVVSNEPLTHEPARRLQLRDFALGIARADHALAAGGVGREASTSLKRLQAVLAPNEAALSVARTPAGLAYLCVRRTSATWRVADADLGRARVDARLVQQALTAGHAPNERLDSQFPVEAAGRLYDVYLRPFEACLKPGDSLIWLPGIAGLSAPLGVLLRTPPPKLANGGYDLAQADWLVRRHPVGYAGSPALLVAARQARAAGGDFDFLGVGDPVLPGAAAGTRGVARTRGVRIDGLAPLPETREELKATAAVFRRPRLLLGEEATERRLRGQMLGAYDYLSFATHGLIRDDLQGLAEPALVLTPVNAEDPLDDGLLTASEIADLNLRARFVALSACNTANFDLDQLAQDLPALSSAFAVAGVPSVLATLWPVDSQTGQQVVAAAFGRLREAGVGPAEALAQAQRAFLAAPPGKAWLHPRFWAPFVILGDGGTLPSSGQVLPALREVEVLTQRGGEAIAVQRVSGDALAALLISDADEAGRRGAAVRLARNGVEAWHAHRHDLGASKPLLSLGGRLVAAGYRLGPNGRYAPVLEAFGPDGQRSEVWQAEPLGGLDGFVLAATPTGPNRAVFALGALNLRGADRPRGARLQLYAMHGDLKPSLLAEVTPPRSGAIDDATVASLGTDLIVTYTTRSEPPPPASPAFDDWNAPLCAGVPVTWIELRDGATGALKASRELPGWIVTTALTDARRVLIGGSTTAACGAESQANVASIGADMAPRPLWTDTTLGVSEVRALSLLTGGRTLVAAHKRSVVDFAPVPQPGARPDPYRIRRTDVTFSGMVLTLGRDGAASEPRLIDSGSNVLLTAAETSNPADLLIAGALGGEAAIFHLTPGR